MEQQQSPQLEIKRAVNNDVEEFDSEWHTVASVVGVVEVEDQGVDEQGDQGVKMEKQSMISTDSALSSDESLNNSTIRELGNQAELLLLYFKRHRDVVEYMGIGLTEVSMLSEEIDFMKLTFFGAKFKILKYISKKLIFLVLYLKMQLFSVFGAKFKSG
jgi:hypothetical protein